MRAFARRAAAKSSRMILIEPRTKLARMARPKVRCPMQEPSA
jgi:hypothetical protein